MVKYAVCYVCYSIGEATESSRVLWLASELKWTLELEEAGTWADKAEAESFLNAVKQFMFDRPALNVVAINWYENLRSN